MKCSKVVNTQQMQSTSKSGKRRSLGANESLCKPRRFKDGVKSVDEEESTDEESAIMSEFDYHDTINSENYEKYFEKVCQLLKPNSVIVTDNASDHSRNDVNYPLSKWKKAQFQDWLTHHNIPFNSDDLRAELYGCFVKDTVLIRHPKLLTTLQRNMAMKFCVYHHIIANLTP